MARSLQEYEELINGYYDDWSSFLGISQQWDVQIKIVDFKKSDDEDDSDAECSWPSNYTTAVMKISKKWLKKQPPDQEVESTVVHELGHLVFHRMWDEINRLFAGELRDRFTNIEETNVDIWTRQIMRARNEKSCEHEEETVPLIGWTQESWD
jgi:hypothetical protein